MKIIPIISEIESDFQEMKKLVHRLGKLRYKYEDPERREKLSEEEYIQNGLEALDDLHYEYNFRQEHGVNCYTTVVDEMIKD